MNRRALPLKTLLAVNTALLGAAALLSCWYTVNPLYAVLFSILMTLAVAIDMAGLRHPARLPLNVASASLLAVSVMRMRFDNLIAVFTEAVLVMVAIKALEDKRPRDYCQIAALSVFTIISSAVDNMSERHIYFGIIDSVLVGFQFILSTWFSHDPAALLTPRELSRVAGRGAVIWVMMLPLCLLLFFAAPRARLTLGQMQMSGAGDSTVGFSERVALGSVRNIQEVNALAFRAEMPLVAPKHMFWKGFVLNDFDGREWHAGGRGRQERVVPRGAQTVKQEIFIENAGYMRPLFALDIALMVNAPGVVQASDGVFVNTNFRTRLKHYSAVSSLSDMISPSSGNIRRERYLRLPDSLSPAIRALAQGLLDGVGDGDKPEAIMSHLSPPRFSYSLTDLPVSPAPLDEFLFRTQSGNCEFFATAMAVMLRAGGIPSRLVAGYRGGVYNDSGGYYVVNQSNAHVWVEAWDDAEGAWRRYDPTPASNEAGGDAEGAARYGFWWQYIDYINYSVSRVFMEYGGESQSRLMDSVRDFFTSPSDSISEIMDSFYRDRRKTGAAAALATAVFLILAAVKCRLYLRGRRGLSRDEILRARFLSVMRRRGFAKKQCDGLEDFAGEVAAELGGGNRVAEAAAEFASVFGKYYFKDVPIEAAEFKKLELIVKNIGKNPGESH
jgi:hypothetical protein